MRAATAVCLLAASACTGARLPSAGVPVATAETGISDDKIAQILTRFESPDGPRLARELVADSTAARKALPQVIERFRASLATRVRSRVSYIPDTPAVHVRDSSLIVFRSLRSEARAALPGLLELLRRRQLEDEYAGASLFMTETVIAAVSEGDPSQVIAAAGHRHRSVRVACCRAMGYMKHSAATVGPALEDLLGDPDLMVVMQAVEGLGKLQWVTPDGLKKLVRRAEQESDPSDKQHLKAVIDNFRERLGTE